MSVPNFSINTDVNDIENNPPLNSARSTSSRGFGKPLSPHPINIASSPKIINNNHIDPAATSNRYKDQIFQLNLEIQSLKQRLSLTSSTSKNELLDLLSEKDTVIANKSKQINALNDKFTKITKAVNGMEREMNALRKSKKESDDDLKKVNRYLGIREKEVNVLVGRCASQEEKLNDMKGARLLEKELNTMKKIRDKEKLDHDREIQGLMADLQQEGNEKQALLGEIESLKNKNRSSQDQLDAAKNEVQHKRDKINDLYEELKDLHDTKEKESTECIAIRKNLHDLKNIAFERDTQIDDLQTRHKNEMNSLRSAIVEQKKNDEQSLADLSSSKDAEIDNLKMELEMKQSELVQTADSLKQCKDDYETVCMELSALQENYNKLSSLTKEEAEENENERNLLEKQLTAKLQENKEMKKTNVQLLDNNQSNTAKMAKLKEKLEFLENELRNMTEKEMDLMDIQNKKMNMISKLEDELRRMEEEKEKRKAIYNEKYNSLEEEGMEMQSKIETIIQKYEGQVGQLNHDLGIERSKAENYWEELEHLRSKSLKHDDLRQVEIKLLEDSVKAAKAQIKSKDDEVNHLKNMELKHEKERANRLEEKILEMGKAYENCEMDGAMVVDDLNNKLVIAADKHAKLEEDKSLVISESKKSIGILEAKIRAFETNFVTLKRELTSKTSQIATLEDMIRELSNEKNAQDHNVDQWKGDLDKLINAYEQCKTDHAVTVRSLQADYNDFKKKAQHDASLFQQDYDSLQRLAAETEGKFDRQSNELNATYKELEEKKVVIQEMIDSQRSNDHEMKEARAVIAELQDASDSVGKHAEQYRRRYQDLQLQFETEVNKHIDEIQHRDLTRKEMDRKMKKLEKEIQTLRTELKSTEELRAANYLLQDKVDRQEKFLMRKLEKEKKHRMFPVPTSTAQRSDRSRSVSRQPSDVSKIQNSSSSTRSRSHSTNRQPPRAGDELDDLLA